MKYFFYFLSLSVLGAILNYFFWEGVYQNEDKE